jgi:hypothetical protein
LWDLVFGGGSPANGRPDELFFDAGVNAVSFAGNGLFGVIHAAGQGDPEDRLAPPRASVGAWLDGDPPGAGVASVPDRNSAVAAAPTVPAASGPARIAVLEQVFVELANDPGAVLWELPEQMKRGR